MRFLVATFIAHNVTFYMDGSSPSRSIHDVAPDKVSWLFNVALYDVQNVSTTPSPHVVSMVLNSYLNGESWIYFDHAIITEEQPHSPHSASGSSHSG